MKFYKSGRFNLACTVFVPYDCNHNCKFCTSKKMYKTQKMDIDRIIDNIRFANDCHVISEFVITGGEPFADLHLLKDIINVCQKKVFINTTLPKDVDIDGVLDLINYEPKIQGVNVSRHMGFDFADVVDADVLSEIGKPIRINSIITNVNDMERFISKRWPYGAIINLRADYRKITNETLKVRDEIDNWLLEHYTYKGNTSCMVCNSEFFGDKYIALCYHRGLEHSCFTCGDSTYVNDVIIHPDGSVHKDWGEQDEDEDFTFTFEHNFII